MKQTMSLSEFSCLSEYTRHYPNVGLCCLVDIIRIGEIEKSIPRMTDWHHEACEGHFFSIPSSHEEWSMLLAHHEVTHFI